MIATFLVVDDMPMIREPITAALRLAAYRAVCPTNGREALSLLGAERAALLPLDLEKSRMDGLEVRRRLRNAAGPDLSPVMVPPTGGCDGLAAVVIRGQRGVHFGERTNMFTAPR